MLIGVIIVARASKNYTFSLPIELLEKLKSYTEDGYASSVNAAVREAIEEYVVQIDKKYLYTQMKNASEDPLFLEDLDKAMVDFSYTDHEATAEKIKK
jgi:predicted DNA-binding protein